MNQNDIHLPHFSIDPCNIKSNQNLFNNLRDDTWLDRQMDSTLPLCVTSVQRICKNKVSGGLGSLCTLMTVA